MLNMIKNKMVVRGMVLLAVLSCLLVLYNFSKFRSMVPYSYRQVYQLGNVRQFQQEITNPYINDSPIYSNDSERWRPSNDTEGEGHRKVRVLCWIMTQPKKSAQTKCQAIRSTWGKRCDVLLYFSSKTDYNFPIIGLNVTEGRSHLTAKTMGAFEYIYKHHFNDADWFMKADDDAYVIVENLKYFLSEKNPENPVYYGQVFTAYVKPRGYNSGGAGYVLSKEALKRFGHRQPSLCLSDGGVEDLDFGECLKKLDVFPGDTFDKTGRSRFHGLSPGELLFKRPIWYSVYDVHGGKRGISRYAISFHYMSTHDMYMMDFALHHLKAHGHIFPPYRQNDNGEEASPYS